jgi:hypothetical protein
MRVIQQAVVSAREGLDPQVANPNDPWQRPMNYPKIWVRIGEALSLPDEPCFIAFCSLVLISFCGVCAFLLYKFPTLLFLASLVSTATLFGIERGNIDLIIFCLVFSFLLLMGNPLSPVLALIAVALKFYPAFCVSALLIRRHYLHFFVSAIGVIIILLYSSDLAKIRLTTPTSTQYSYGLPSIAAIIEHHGWPGWYLAVLVSAVCAAIAALMPFLWKFADKPPAGFQFTLFLGGASIYVGTFIFLANWDYRLIFLIFCVPLLQAGRLPFGRSLVGVILLAMNELPLRALLGVPGLAMVWISKVGLFIVFSAYLNVLGISTIIGRREVAEPSRQP